MTQLGVAEPLWEGGVEDLCRFEEGPLSKSSAKSSHGLLLKTDNGGEAGDAYMGDGGHGTRNGFFFFSKRGRPQPHLGHF